MEAFSNRTPLRISRRNLLRTAVVGPLALPLIPFGCSESQHRQDAASGPPVVRVLVAENRPRVELRASEPPMVRIGAGPAARIGLATGSTVPVVFTGSGWRIGEVGLATGEMTLESPGAGSIAVDGHAYRGRYRFIPRPSGKFDVVNDVDVDDYLSGVIAREMYPNWHAEAYRAQAVVARTYALYVARTGSTQSHFDLFADTRSQVYGGIAGESAKARQAVEETRGWVVAYGQRGEERIFKAYFSSCCGGITQPATIFGDPPCEALTEQNIGPRCALSPRFSWPAVVILRAEITRRLRAWGAMNNAPEQSIGDVARIDILSTNRFGRPSSFAVTDVRGYRYRMGCEDLRIAINTDASDGVKLPSSFCRPVTEGAAIRFADGHGFGHGVGMCQWCAQEQATSGVGYEQIVVGAFPKSVMVQAY